MHNKEQRTNTTRTSYRASPLAPAWLTNNGLVVASVINPVFAYRETVSISPESIESVVISANDSNADICNDVVVVDDND